MSRDVARPGRACGDASRQRADIDRRESQSALDGIITMDSHERIVSWNDGARRLFGYDRDQALGQHPSLIVPGYTQAAYHQGLVWSGAHGEPHLARTTVEMDARTAQGATLPVELSLSRWYRGAEPFYTAVIRDVSERKRHEAELAWRATHDPATGLPNMGALGEWFDEHCSGLPEGHLRVVFCLQLANLSTLSSGWDPTRRASWRGWSAPRSPPPRGPTWPSATCATPTSGARPS